MASLLDLTSQGDVATITDDAYLNRTLQLMSPQQLYELWERQQWQSQAIDLERDNEQWAELPEEQKDEHLWGLSSFFVGEERVTTQFSGLVMAYEDEQEEAFLTAQHFMLDYYENNDLLPGFAEGFTNIARDEHRHVAYGTWFLQQKCAEERYRGRVQETLNELLPLAAGVLVPKGYALGDDYEFFGYTAQEQAEFAYSALTRRLKVIGLALPTASAA